MESLIEKIWCDYFCELTSEIRNAEEKDLLSTTVNIEEELIKRLNSEERDLLERFTASIYESQRVLLKNGFVDGVKFGVEFVIDALFCDNIKGRNF